MYQDPRHIKKHPYKVSLNDSQRNLIEIAANAVGEQPTAYLRDLALEKLEEIMKEKDRSNVAVLKLTSK